jgi:hypothetical protein
MKNTLFSYFIIKKLLKKGKEKAKKSGASLSSKKPGDILHRRKQKEKQIKIQTV